MIQLKREGKTETFSEGKQIMKKETLIKFTKYLLDFNENEHSKIFLNEEFQLINVEEMKEQENHHQKTTAMIPAAVSMDK